MARFGAFGEIRVGEGALAYLLQDLGAGERRAAETRRTAQCPLLSPVPLAETKSSKTENFFFNEGISVSHLFPPEMGTRPRPAPPHDSDNGVVPWEPQGSSDRRAYQAVKRGPLFKLV